MQLATLSPPWDEGKPTVEDGDVGIRGNDVDVVGADLLAVDSLRDFHLGRLRKCVGEEACVRGLQVLNEDKCHPRAGRKLIKQLRECLKAPR